MAAISVADRVDEQLVVVAETKAKDVEALRELKPQVTAAFRRHTAFGSPIWSWLGEFDSVTTSGKVRRSASGERYRSQ